MPFDFSKPLQAKIRGTQKRPAGFPTGLESVSQLAALDNGERLNYACRQVYSLYL